MHFRVKYFRPIQTFQTRVLLYYLETNKVEELLGRHFRFWNTCYLPAPLPFLAEMKKTARAYVHTCYQLFFGRSTRCKNKVIFRTYSTRSVDLKNNKINKGFKTYKTKIRKYLNIKHRVLRRRNFFIA